MGKTRGGMTFVGKSLAVLGADHITGYVFGTDGAEGLRAPVRPGLKPSFSQRCSRKGPN